MLLPVGNSRGFHAPLLVFFKQRTQHSAAMFSATEYLSP